MSAAVQLALPLHTVSENNQRGCAVKGCSRPHCARGYCNTHYANVRRGGQPVPATPKARAWTPADLDRLRDVYTGPPPLRTQVLAEELGRSVAAIHLKASRMGLGDWHRAKVLEKKRRRMFDNDEDRAAHLSAVRKAWLANHGHPRGALGMKHSAETKAKLSQRSKAAWSDPMSALNSDAAAQRRSDNMLQRIQAGAMRSGYSRGAGGRREDLGGLYVRSSWEANYARYLNWRIARGELLSWQYEPHTFVFGAIKRGTRAYTPDFRLTFPDGRVEWHEVKGWMDQKSATRLRRMAKYFPHEVVRVIDSAWFKMARRSELAAAVPCWEGARPRRLRRARMSQERQDIPATQCGTPTRPRGGQVP